MYATLVASSAIWFFPADAVWIRMSDVSSPGSSENAVESHELLPMALQARPTRSQVAAVLKTRNKRLRNMQNHYPEKSQQHPIYVGRLLRAQGYLHPLHLRDRLQSRMQKLRLKKVELAEAVSVTCGPQLRMNLTCPIPQGG